MQPFQYLFKHPLDKGVVIGCSVPESECFVWILLPPLTCLLCDLEQFTHFSLLWFYYLKSGIILIAKSCYENQFSWYMKNLNSAWHIVGTKLMFTVLSVLCNQNKRPLWGQLVEEYIDDFSWHTVSPNVNAPIPSFASSTGILHFIVGHFSALWRYFFSFKWKIFGNSVSRRSIGMIFLTVQMVISMF